MLVCDPAAGTGGFLLAAYELNFVQHVKSLMTINGRAAVVVPDNVLFEGGAGETIRRKLLRECDLHTLLRLPTGIFYAGGVKANVLFLDRKPPSEQPRTDKLWIYDFRTNQRFTLKTRALVRADLDDFVTCYNPASRHERMETERFRAFSYDELMARDKASLDIFWLRDESLEDSENLPAPEVIAAEIVEDLQAALDQFAAIAASLGGASAQAELVPAAVAAIGDHSLGFPSAGRLAARSAALRPMQNSFPSGSASTTPPVPSARRRSSSTTAPRRVARSICSSRLVEVGHRSKWMRFFAVFPSGTRRNNNLG